MTRTLPGRYYTDPELYRREQERIFSRMWVYAGPADRLAQPGAFLSPTVAGESILVIRGHDGVIRAFFNVCPHRGSRLVRPGEGRCAKVIQCPYHAWSFGLDGALVAAPMLAALAERDFDREAYGLRPIAVGVWHGLVWINLSSSPPPLEPQVEQSIEARFGRERTFERYGLGKLKHAKALDYVVAANWKLVVENFMECTHCGPMHPELVRLVPAFRTGKASYHNGGQGVLLAPDAEAFSMSMKARYARLPDLEPDDLRRFHAFVLRPNVLVVLVHDHVVVFRLLPEAPDRTHVRCEWLFAEAAVTHDDFDPADAVTLFDTVNQQDWAILEETQCAMGSRAWEHGGIYGPSEEHLREFNDFVVARIEEGGRP